MQDKPPLLFLAHRIPYPPNKGDKIRSFHLLKHLSEHFSIYLGTFVDDEDDWQYCAAVRRYCADAYFVARNPRWHKLWAARGLLGSRSLSQTYYQNGAMQRWVDRTVTQHHIDRVLLFCSPMGQFVCPDSTAGDALENIVVDFVDLDSEKWRQYSENHSGPMRWLYQREGERLLAEERAIAAFASRSFFVSEPEAALFRERAPESAAKVAHFSNGVDTAYFRPNPELPNPYPAGVKALVFTGAMDYWPNVDAVTWFAKEVFPELYSLFPGLEFWVVGGKPVDSVTALAQLPGVHVTGRVPDVRPYIQYSLAVVAPMKIARGVQNKVLEALAMGARVVGSSGALEGLEFVAHTATRCDHVADYVAFIPKLFSDGVNKLRSQPADATIAFSVQWKDMLEPLVEQLSKKPPFY
jgi:sugar transferase (PEP-CTERM/EpsH1 system associated)